MEQLNKGQPKPTIQHFSHPHALNLQNNQNQSRLCSGCNHAATGLVYSCTPCGYFLHISCSQMPQQITHPCDQSHVLSLHTKPSHHKHGVFKCAACLKDDTCFSYHCATCSVDLHVTCAAAALSLSRQALHHHPLSLVFSPPYPHETYNCDVCRRVGVKGWVYRCETCDFDAHFECARPNPNAADASSQFDPTQYFFSVLRSYNCGQPMGMGSGTNYIYGQNYNNSISNMTQMIQRMTMQANAQNNQMLQQMTMQANAQNRMNQIMLQQLIRGGSGSGGSGNSGSGGAGLFGGGGGAGLFDGCGGGGANYTMSFGGDPSTMAFGGGPSTMAFGGDPSTYTMPPEMADYLNSANYGSGFDFTGSFSGSGVDFAGGFDFGGISGFPSFGLF